jgi:adenylylsulfate kinase
MLVATAGLPGTGKSTLATRLTQELRGVVLSKDAVRAALFPPPALDYTTAQDDLVMAAIFNATEYILRAHPERVVLLDGRTFLRAYQVNDLLTLAARLNQPLRIIECICDDAVARQRLEQDLASGQHLAGNRTYQLYLEVKARGEPIALPHLTLDTGRLSLQQCVDSALEFLRRFSPEGLLP